jgi:hypothetical protein
MPPWSGPWCAIGRAPRVSTKFRVFTESWVLVPGCWVLYTVPAQQWPASQQALQGLPPFPHPPEQQSLQVQFVVLRDPSSGGRAQLSLWCVFLRSAEAVALLWKPNRDSLVAGLQEDATDVCLELVGYHNSDFNVLCKAMAVLGPVVRSVAIGIPSDEFQWLIDDFVTGLASCSRLVELRWVLWCPYLASTACL